MTIKFSDWWVSPCHKQNITNCPSAPQDLDFTREKVCQHVNTAPQACYAAFFDLTPALRSSRTVLHERLGATHLGKVSF